MNELYLVINCGSSSLKFSLYKMPDEELVCKGYVEKIGLSDSFWNIKYKEIKYTNEEYIKDHKNLQLKLNQPAEKKAINMDVPFEEIIERIANRRSCSKCNSVYNVVFNPPKQEGICDECGETLYQREDQKPEIVQNLHRNE